MIEVNCPSCSTVLEAPDSAAGRLSTCPHCQESLEIPDQPTPAPTSPSRPVQGKTATQAPAGVAKQSTGKGERTFRRNGAKTRPTPQRGKVVATGQGRSGKTRSSRVAPRPKQSKRRLPVFVALIAAALLVLIMLQGGKQTAAGKGPAYDAPETTAASAQIDPAPSPEAESTMRQPAAQWMSGTWGIGWRISGGSSRYTKRLKVKQLVEQVKTIPGMRYVLFNLSNGADGSLYTAPHAVLSNVTPGVCPERDVFVELATAFQAEGYKVLVYMATEGPAKLKHGPVHETAAKRIENWKAWVREAYGKDDVDTLKQAYAEVIVREFAQRYGTKIDGWWFDHASFGNIELIHKEVTRGNPKAVVAFSRGPLGITVNSNPDYEDYTFGHPTPLRRVPASSDKNLPMVTSIEESTNGFLIKDGKPSLGHMFMPMKNRWNSGADVVWEEEQAVDWMQRVLTAGGAWTWNVPYNDKTSQLDPEAVDFAKRVGSQLQ